jgi:4-amino-4-deoxy-L-arabinose transferase-like glycosyltransferase
MEGLYREHPVGLFVPAALLARLGFPAEQAAYAMNAAYQVLTVVLVTRLAATIVPGLEARALGWLIQLIPIAFTFRIRANQEQAVLLCLLLALYGTEKARERPRWALLTVAGLVGLLLLKGVLAVFGPALCALWLLCRRRTSGPGPRESAAWLGVAVGVAAMAGTTLAYELLYRAVTGESFLAVYLGRQLGAAAVAQSEAGLAQKAYNAVWYLCRVVWFPSPWSLTLILGAWTALRARRSGWRLDHEGSAGLRAGALFAVGVTVLYVGLFSLSDRRADRYIFAVYYAVAAAGAVGALRAWPALRRLAERLDRPWVPAAVWSVTFLLHLFAGRVGITTIKLWAPDS